MAVSDRGYVKERGVGRRKNDWRVRDLNSHYEQLLHIGQIITSEININLLFEVIIEQTNRVMNAERSTVFVYDDKSNRLWSLEATGLKKNQIHIPIDSGVAGWVFMSKTPVIINNAYNDPNFNAEVDRVTGFKTKKILCVPLLNTKKQCIGVLETLNKVSDDFNTQDIELLTSVSHYVTIALGNAKLYENLKSLDRAKEKIINHLSHELRTPISIISGTLMQISKILKDEDSPKIKKAIDRGQRNLDRLIDLQGKIDDIMNSGSIQEKESIMRIIEGAMCILEEIGKEDHKEQSKEVLKIIGSRLESLYKIELDEKEEIDLDKFLFTLCKEAKLLMRDRRIDIVQNNLADLTLTFHKNILEKICNGILKNAIENSPDDGIIEIFAKSTNGDYQIDFKDFGVGITSQNQKLIFGGFFHTQDTKLYSSKRPYQFNAGGTGSDLLRLKCFSERLGFSINFESTRCRYLPTDADVCPGKVSDCPFIDNKSECFSAGGTTFSLRFPMKIIN
jgi:signal transduction histidine kinase